MTIKEYQKDLNKDVSDFLTELQQKFPDMVITSGFRKNSVTKFGKKSRHSTGEAADLRINPEISDWLYNTKEGITTLNKYGLGMLDESLPENKKFGNAVHIGKDAIPVEKAKNRYKELFGVEYGQEPQPQEQENVINYVSPTQDTTIVTNLPKSEESINFAEETRKLEQQKQEEFQKIEQEINQRTQVQQQEQQIEEEEYVQPTPQINYQDIFNQVSQFVDAPIAQQGGTKKKILKTTDKVVEASFIGKMLDFIPGAETVYDIKNVISGLGEGDYKKIGANTIGALLPGISGKAFEAVAEDWLPETPEIEKKKIRFNMNTSSSQRQEYLKKYGNGYLSNPVFIKEVLDKYQEGGIKIDPMGYWNPENLGSPVVIPSNRISMKNLDFSVLGVADTGETKLMHPNEEHYFSGAKKVTEYPIEYIKKLRNGR